MVAAGLLLIADMSQVDPSHVLPVSHLALALTLTQVAFPAGTRTHAHTEAKQKCDRGSRVNISS